MSHRKSLGKFCSVVALCLSLVGCRTVKEVQIVIDSVYITDTTTQTVHDTIKTKEIIHDSVDRRVEKIVYVDSGGVWHEKEKETLTHYIYQQSEEYKARESEYKSKISDLEKQLSEQQKVEYVEKELSWLQKTEIYGFWICLALAALYIACKKLKNKINLNFLKK